MTIRNGAEITVRSLPSTEATHLRHLVGGIGLGLALYQRGIFTLHASAVAVGGVAVAIAGPKGAGKSTLVTALAARGHSLVTDDVVALDFPVGERPRVRVGAASVNLWPDSAAATGRDSSMFEAITSFSPKLAGVLPTVSSRDPVPLGAIILLARGDSIDLSRLSPLEAFPELVGHSHAFRWVEREPNLPRHLAACRQLLECVPVFRLHRGSSLDTLAELAARVEALVGDTAPGVEPAPPPTDRLVAGRT
ncbi:MAG TPA: hypothetical protein VGE02_14010 [Gemmatimonadales bacterium]